LLVVDDEFRPGVPGDDLPLGIQQENAVILDILHQEAVLLVAVPERQFGLALCGHGSIPPPEKGAETNRPTASAGGRQRGRKPAVVGPVRNPAPGWAGRRVCPSRRSPPPPPARTRNSDSPPATPPGGAGVPRRRAVPSAGRRKRGQSFCRG